MIGFPGWLQWDGTVNMGWGCVNVRSTMGKNNDFVDPHMSEWAFMRSLIFQIDFYFTKHTGWEPVIPFEKTMRDLLDYWRNKVSRGDAFPTR